MEILHHTSKYYKKQEEFGSKTTAKQTFQKSVLGKKTFFAQHRQQNGVSLRSRKAAELSGLWLIETRSYS